MRTSPTRSPRDPALGAVDVTTASAPSPTPAGHGIAFGEAVRVWARIAALSFGGPAGQIAVMHRILVEEKRWIGEARFLHALNYCMLLPGPEAQQLAVYIGWLLHRTLGGLVAGTLFVLPGFVAIMALSWLYAGLGDVPVVEALFFGLKAAVLAIVLEAVVRIGRRALRNAVMVALAAAAFVAIFVFDVPFPLIVLGAGLVGLLGARAGLAAFVGGGHRERGTSAITDAESALGETTPEHARPTLAWSLGVAGICLLLWLGPVLALLLALGSDDVFTKIAVFFSKMAVVTFGGAYAVLAYVAQQAVETYGWLEPGEMLDGLGLAETTPGPLIMVVQFVGFMGAFREPGPLPAMVAGTLGGILTTWVTFVPCFLWIFLGAPFVEALRGNRALGGALAAITAAVVGVILNLAVWFGLHVWFGEVREVEGFGMSLDVPVLATIDPAALALTLAAIVAVFHLKIGMLPVLAACSAAGVLYFLAVGAIA
jgi:chromate transporter